MLISLYFRKLREQPHPLKKIFIQKQKIFLALKNIVKKRTLKINTCSNYNKLIKFSTTTSIFLVSNQNDPYQTFVFFNFLNEQVYYSVFFKNKTFIKHLNVQEVIPKFLLPYIMYTTKTVNWRRYKIIHSNEIIEILFISLWLKNLTMFMKWVRRFFEKDEIKKHKKLFLLLNTLLGKVIWGFNIFLKLRGLRTTVKGKFGKAGSVRKSRRYIKRGKCSYTSKNIAMVSQTKVIRTLTGVFSIKLEVFY